MIKETEKPISITLERAHRVVNVDSVASIEDAARLCEDLFNSPAYEGYDVILRCTNGAAYIYTGDDFESLDE